jgi:hypothetical protein
MHLKAERFKMSVLTLDLSEVSKLPENERQARYSDFMRVGIVPNGEMAELDRQITAFERVYEVSSDTMQQQLAAGRIRETAEICRWLMLLELRNRVRKHTV